MCIQWHVQLSFTYETLISVFRPSRPRKSGRWLVPLRWRCPGGSQLVLMLLSCTRPKHTNISVNCKTIKVPHLWYSFFSLVWRWRRTRKRRTRTSCVACSAAATTCPHPCKWWPLAGLPVPQIWLIFRALNYLVTLTFDLSTNWCGMSAVARTMFLSILVFLRLFFVELRANKRRTRQIAWRDVIKLTFDLWGHRACRVSIRRPLYQV